MTTSEHHHPAEGTRRDFLYIATGAMGAVGAGALLWPFIDQMNPDEGALALSSVDVDVSALNTGESMTVMWRGKPVFIRRRTEEEVAAAKDVDVGVLRDPDSRNPNNPDGPTSPAIDANRAVAGREDMLIMIGVCTHLGCIPLGQQGEFGGWFCPCHGSAYDTAGRIRVGPAPENLAIPPYTFAADGNTVTLG